MTRLDLGALGICVALGLGLAKASPAAWHVGPTQGALLGGATYAVALRRYLERLALEPWRSRGRDRARWIPGLLARAVAFMALVAFQCYLYFEIAPGTDVRASFAVLSTWVVVQALTDRRRGGSA